MAGELAEAGHALCAGCLGSAQDTFMRLLRQYSQELQEPRAFFAAVLTGGVGSRDAQALHGLSGRSGLFAVVVHLGSGGRRCRHVGPALWTDGLDAPAAGPASQGSCGCRRAAACHGLAPWSVCDGIDYQQLSALACRLRSCNAQCQPVFFNRRDHVRFLCGFASQSDTIHARCAASHGAGRAHSHARARCGSCQGGL